MGNSPSISQYAMIPPGDLGIMSEVRQANCNTVDVLPPSDTLALPQDGASTTQDVQAYHYSQDLLQRDFVADGFERPIWDCNPR